MTSASSSTLGISTGRGDDRCRLVPQAMTRRGLWLGVYLAAASAFVAAVAALVKYGHQGPAEAIYLVTGFVLVPRPANPAGKIGRH
jgi:hypothetical protein